MTATITDAIDVCNYAVLHRTDKYAVSVTGYDLIVHVHSFRL